MAKKILLRIGIAIVLLATWLYAGELITAADSFGVGMGVLLTVGSATAVGILIYRLITNYTKGSDK